MKVAAAKKPATGKKSRVVAAPSPSTSDVENANTPPTKKSSKAKKPVVASHKITEFFHVRRSTRKTGKQIKLEAHENLRDLVLNKSNEAILEIYLDAVKGRGIKTTVNFSKGDFVLEYIGNMMEYSEAKTVEEAYSHEEVGSYMYFFEHKNKKWCIDATAESPFKGRLINHSVLRPNLKTKVVEIDGRHHLIFVALREIEVGEELLYDYGDRSAETLANNPWLLNT
ncbi:hypothetical protein B9Z55_009278 [Caenorhabditis nigoni]|uniref:[histone H4]-lysine(20) N-methyltransferase n=1 Tax=Caenorhabditis nigoni TaxID=1611254 RepID=A0A2G5URD8_9PELO|nr:hypothetical protein B9Z55_009278 [Caenorhabditis nigoni]